MKKILLFLFVVLFAFGITGVANALTLDSSVGTWSNPNPSVGSFINYNSFANTDYLDSDGNPRPENQIRWGDPTTTDGEQSGLGFTGVAPPPYVFGIGDAFEIGQLRHFNSPIWGGTGVGSVDLTIALTFFDPAGLAGSFEFNFTVNETTNSIPPSSADDDYIYFPSSFADETLTIGGKEYTLELLGFGDTAESLDDQFQSPEGSTNATLLWGKITTPSSVPEPGTMLLFGFGLLGVLGVRRKFKK
jgi:hypothetical protein